jgi:hypothetical protein
MPGTSLADPTLQLSHRRFELLKKAERSNRDGS